MNDQKKIEGIVSEIDAEGIVVAFSDSRIKFPITDHNYRKGDKVYLYLLSEEEEKLTKEEIAKALLNEILKNGQEQNKKE